MRCGRCNSIIADNSMHCIGCGASIQELKNNNMIINENVVPQNTNQDSMQNIQSNDSTNKMMGGNVQSNDSTNQMMSGNVQSNDSTSQMMGGNVQSNDSTSQMMGGNVQSNGSTNQMMSGNIQTNDQIGSSKKSLKIIIPIVSVLVVVIIALGLFLTLGKSPKLVFKKAINNIAGSINNTLEGNFDTATISMYLQPDFDSTDDTSMAAFDILNQLSLDLDLEIDKKNEVFNVDIKTKYQNEKLVNIDGSIQNKKIYMRFEDSQDYVYNESDFELSESDDSYVTIVEGFRKALVDSVEADYFTQTKQTLSINGKNVKTTKNTLVLNASNVSKIAESITNSLINNDKFIDAYVSTTGESKENVIYNLQNMNFQDSESTSVVNLSIYTTGIFKKFVKLELEGNGSTMSFIKESDSKYVFNITSGTESMDLAEINISEVNGEKIYHIIVAAEGEQIGLKLGYNVVYDQKITPKNVSNSVNVEYLQEEETYEFMSVLMENKGFVSFVNDVSAFGNTYGGTDYDDDYDYDDDDDFSYSGTFTTDDIDRDNVVLSDGVTIKWD